MDAWVLGDPTAADSIAAFVPPPWVAPILSTGVVGVILLMVLFRYKIQPTYVLDDAKREWERERAALEARHAEERRHDRRELVELRRETRRLKDGVPSSAPR